MKIDNDNIIIIGAVVTVILLLITGITYSPKFMDATILSGIFTVGKLLTDPNN